MEGKQNQVLGADSKEYRKGKREEYDDLKFVEGNFTSNRNMHS